MFLASPEIGPGGMDGECLAAQDGVMRATPLRNAGKGSPRKGKVAVTQSGPPDRAGLGGGELADFDASVPNPARMWNYWVGGTIARSPIRFRRSIRSWPARAAGKDAAGKDAARLSLPAAGALAEELSNYAASNRSKKERYRRKPRLRSSVDTSSPPAHLDSS